MKTCWFIIIESLGRWWVDCEGKAYGPFADRAEAATEAQRIALAYGDSRRQSEIYATDDDGRPRLLWTGPAPE